MEKKISIFIILIFIFLLFKFIIFVFGSSCKAENWSIVNKNSAIFSYKTTKDSGEFILELWNSVMNTSKFNICIRSYPLKKEKTVKIQDEADVLSIFISLLLKNGIKINQLECLYIPATNEQEVQERLMNEASKNKICNKVIPCSKIVPNLLLTSNAYKEINKVLKHYNSKIIAIDAEKVLSKKRIINKNDYSSINLPYFATVYIYISNIVNNKKKAVRVKKLKNIP